MTEQQTEGQTSEGQETSPTPPWGSDEEFKPDKAWKLIENLRSDLEKAKARPVLSDEDKARLTEFDRITEAAKSDLDKARDEATRWQTETETWRRAAVGSKIQALAASDFADPTDAVAALSANSYLDAGGQVDETAIRRDLDALLQAKPHYRRPSEPATPRAPRPSQAQGVTGSPSTDPAQEFGALIQSAIGR